LKPQDLKKLNLSGVAITAAISPDGSLQKVGGNYEKLLVSSQERSLPRIHTVIVAEAQRKDIERIDPNLLRDDPHAEFRVICAPTFARAVELLQTDAETRWGEILDCTTELGDHPVLVGREWLSARVQAFLEGHKSGYLLIAGTPGIGKSAFVADMIRTQNVPVYHFIKKGRGNWDNPDAFLKSLTAQLRRKYVLPRTEAEEKQSPDEELYTVLQRVSRELSDGEMEIIWLDGLDEAYGETARFAGTALPGPLRERLPDGLFFVLTSRPGEHLNWLADPSLCEPIDLDEEITENEADVRAYFEARNREEGLELPAAFIDEAVRRSENNFLFAVKLIEELRALEPEERTVDRIPVGLRGWMVKQLEYVVDRWMEVNHTPLKSKARREVLQVLGLLAVAREPLTLRILNLFFGSSEVERIEDVLSVAGEFFVARPAGRHPNAPIRFYHSRFQEFILEQIDERQEELHAKFADACQSWYTLKGAAREYALRYLPTHLIGSKGWDALCAILTDFDFVQAKVEADMTFDLVLDYQNALSTVPSTQQSSGRSDLEIWAYFIESESHILANHPNLFFQQALNQPVDSPVAQVAERRLATVPQRHPYLRWINKPQRRVRSPIRRTLTGYTDLISALAVSHDGQSVASGSRDGTLIIWDFNTGQKRWTLEGHRGSIYAVAFSPDSKYVASGSHDQTVIVWDLNTGQKRWTLEGHTDCVFGVTFSPDGKFVVSRSGDRTLIVWNLNNGQEWRILEGHTPVRQGIAFAPDGKTVISAGVDDTVIVWNLDSGQERRRLKGHTGDVIAIAVTPDGRSVVSASVDGTLIVWDLESGQRQWTLEGHIDEITAVAVTPDSRFAISGSEDHTLIVWNLDNGQKRWTLEGHTHEVTAVAVTPDSRFAVSGSLDQTLIVWDIESGQKQCTLEGHMSPISATIEVTPDGQFAVSGGWGGTLLVWNLSNGQMMESAFNHKDGGFGLLTAVAFSPDGRYVVSGHSGGRLIIWDLDSGQQQGMRNTHNGDITALAFSFDGRYVISGFMEGTLLVWDLNNEQVQELPKAYGGNVNALAVSPDGQYMVSGGTWDSTLIVWDLNRMQVQRRLEGHTDEVYSIAFSYDGTFLVSASDDGTLIVWDFNTGQLQRRLEGHRSGLLATAMRPDGRSVVSVDWHGMLMVWNLDTEPIQGRPLGHTEGIPIAFSPDGRYIISGKGDKTLTVRDIEREQIGGKFPAKGGVTAGTVNGNGCIVCGDESGQVYLLQLDSREY